MLSELLYLQCNNNNSHDFILYSNSHENSRILENLKIYEIFYKLLRSSYCYYYNNNRWRSAKSCSIQTPPNNNTPTPTTVGI